MVPMLMDLNMKLSWDGLRSQTTVKAYILGESGVICR
ncbi:hypothetical protein M8C21_013322 [Ambrosia artemisiifolia]|uniref:Uncharacterized protein n=1 Tax=Ambrosia artemisiifolia TaxID=4212 RepID=A0AAD5G6L3_AMBAR|nr:hypothetical protein M8C21_013322 [Ambrosia artemisiifolia]